ncbi:MAG: acyl-CoA synthetase (AMP-forming)/AMP-acid ligase II [Arenicella sp.]|jgi:acyl-CoA synthetase (AMP-forming)/AMP-acid ligase II
MAFFKTHNPLLPEILALHGRWRANQDAVICGDQRLNWKTFIQRNHQFANALIDNDIVVGDTIGIVMSNGIPMMQAIMGSMAAGAVSVPINLSVNDDALLGMLNDSKVKILVLTDDQTERIHALANRLPESLQTILIDDFITTATAAEPAPADKAWLEIDEFTKGHSTDLPEVNYTETSPLNVIYSSGTTGLPKGIVHTQAGRRDWAYDLAIALRYHCNSKTLLTLGLYSNISWVAMLTTLLAGGTCVIHRRFDVATFLQTVIDEQITHTALVPIQFQNIIEGIESGRMVYDLSGVQAMMCCGSPLHAELKQKVFKHFNCGVIELYGLTEGVITTLEPEQAEGRWSSVGKPLIGTDIQIIGSDDEVLSATQSGEIVSRGRITMPGYLNREQANIESCYVDAAGRQWLRTGDIGYFDDEGYLFVVDRKKDMILSGSQNIYPQDIEAVMFEHPAVSEVAVIAAPSKRWGETPVALVVLAADAKSSTGEIMQWSNNKLGRQQRVAEVIVIDKLPRNPNGKVLKRELRLVCNTKQYD